MFYQFEHLREVLSEMMRGGALDGSSGGSDVSLNCRRVVTASKLFLLSFSASNLTKQKKKYYMKIFRYTIE
jgi:hypothetical protein